MDRKANAHWQGDLKTGKGTVSSGSGTLSSTPYSFRDRFEDGTSTNPEELLAAAHAACFTMALSMVLQGEGLKADALDTQCTITFEKLPDGFTITHSKLELTGTVPGATAEVFEKAAQTAKANCPVSRLYKTEISLTAKLA